MRRDREVATSSSSAGLPAAAARMRRSPNCNVNLDDLHWDRPDLDCQFEQARGIPRNLQLDETQLATSTDYYFGADSIALRATFRFGQKIADTERVVKLTVAGAGS